MRPFLLLVGNGYQLTTAMWKNEELQLQEQLLEIVALHKKGGAFSTPPRNNAVKSGFKVLQAIHQVLQAIHRALRALWGSSRALWYRRCTAHEHTSRHQHQPTIRRA